MGEARVEERKRATTKTIDFIVGLYI